MESGLLDSETSVVTDSETEDDTNLYVNRLTLSDLSPGSSVNWNEENGGYSPVIHPIIYNKMNGQDGVAEQKPDSEKLSTDATRGTVRRCREERALEQAAAEKHNMSLDEEESVKTCEVVPQDKYAIQTRFRSCKARASYQQCRLPSCVENETGKRVNSSVPSHKGWINHQRAKNQLCDNLWANPLILEMFDQCDTTLSHEWTFGMENLHDNEFGEQGTISGPTRSEKRSTLIKQLRKNAERGHGNPCGRGVDAEWAYQSSGANEDTPKPLLSGNVEINQLSKRYLPERQIRSLGCRTTKCDLKKDDHMETLEVCPNLGSGDGSRYVASCELGMSCQSIPPFVEDDSDECSVSLLAVGSVTSKLRKMNDLDEVTEETPEASGSRSPSLLSGFQAENMSLVHNELEVRPEEHVVSSLPELNRIGSEHSKELNWVKVNTEIHSTVEAMVEPVLREKETSSIQVIETSASLFRNEDNSSDSDSTLIAEPAYVGRRDSGFVGKFPNSSPTPCHNQDVEQHKQIQDTVMINDSSCETFVSENSTSLLTVEKNVVRHKNADPGDNTNRSENQSEITRENVVQICSQSNPEQTNTGTKDMTDSQQLLRKYVKSHQKRSCNGETYLHKASRKGDPTLIRALIKAGVDVNQADYAGWTPLHEASYKGHIAVVDELLLSGANVNIRGLNGYTALHDAVTCNHRGVVQLLLRYGSNPNTKDEQGRSALDMACNEDIRKLLLSSIKPSGASSHEYQVRLRRDNNPSCSADNPLTKQHKSKVWTLEEVEKMLNEMCTWSLDGPDDTDTFTEALAQVQTLLTDAVNKQKVENEDLSSFREGFHAEQIASLLSQKKHLLHVFKKYNELRLKVHKLRNGRKSEKSSKGQLQDTQPNIVKNKKQGHYPKLCSAQPTTAKSKGKVCLAKKQKLSQIAKPSGKVNALNDTEMLVRLIRDGHVQPGENVFCLSVKKVCHNASLQLDGSVSDRGGRVFSSLKEWVESVVGSGKHVGSKQAWKRVRYRSKPLSRFLITADQETRDSPACLQQASHESSKQQACTQETISEVDFNTIEKILLISEEEFIPNHIVDVYWERFSVSGGSCWDM